MDTVTEDVAITEDISPEEYSQDIKDLKRTVRETDITRIYYQGSKGNTVAKALELVKDDDRLLTEEDLENLIYPSKVDILFQDGDRVAIPPRIVPEGIYEEYTEVLDQLFSLGQRNIGFDKLERFAVLTERKRRSVHLKAAQYVEDYLKTKGVIVNTEGQEDKETLRKLFEILHTFWTFSLNKSGELVGATS